MIEASFWRGRRVFLTGHTGFKGSWLALWLQELGADVTGFALAPPTSPALFEVADVGRGMRSIIGDIRDAQQLRAAISDAKPEIVLHLAAQPLVRRSYVDPVETYATNVMGLVNLFEAIRSTGGVRACVNVTSDKCYENREWTYAYRENDAMGGYDPYSSSKGCAELVTSAYRRSFFAEAEGAAACALASARAGNVIGGGDWAQDRLIPDILRAIEAGAPALIRNPVAIRPWQHVLEPLSGYLTLAQKLCGEKSEAFAQGWNFGPAAADTRPVSWVVAQMIAQWGEGASFAVAPDGGPHEAHLLSLDCLKAHRDLNWRPIWSLESAIKMITDWHRSFVQGAAMRNVTLRQITAYTQQMGQGEGS
jgi:CDP-glucose 4,6-dehydratase